MVVTKMRNEKRESRKEFHCGVVGNICVSHMHASGSIPGDGNLFFLLEHFLTEQKGRNGTREGGNVVDEERQQGSVVVIALCVYVLGVSMSARCR